MIDLGFDVADLYREIGKLLRSMGAERVYLYSSKTLTDEEFDMELKIVTDGDVDTAKAEAMIGEKYPKASVQVLNGNEPENMELVEEAVIDSIQI